MCEIEGALKEEATAFGWCPVIFLWEGQCLVGLSFVFQQDNDPKLHQAV
jgi:hypothetical protein